MLSDDLHGHLKLGYNLHQETRAHTAIATTTDADRAIRELNNPTLTTLFTYDKSTYQLQQLKKKKNKKESTTDLLIEVERIRTRHGRSAKRHHL